MQAVPRLPNTLISLRSVFSLRDLVTAAVLGESHNDQKQRDDGANVVYVVGKLDQRDGTKHVVTIYVRPPNEAIKKALWVSTPGLLPGGGYHSLSLQSQSDGHRASNDDATPFILVVKSGFMLKASAIPDGARWITVNSHGDGKGTPVLIQETKHGSGVYHVIGGAGGKLNYLKLRGVKSKEHYAQEVREKQGAKRDEKKAQIKREKENGTHESQQAASRACR